MLIFLDIDGVMVPAKSWQRPELLSDGFPAFSQDAVSALQSLMSDNTTIILTTSHKSTYTIPEWKSIFATRGIITRNLLRLDNNINRLNRKEEILNWFAKNTVNEDFVIIDDDKSLNDLPKEMKKRLILTSGMVGLSNHNLTNQIVAYSQMR